MIKNIFSQERFLALVAASGLFMAAFGVIATLSSEHGIGRFSTAAVAQSGGTNVAAATDADIISAAGPSNVTIGTGGSVALNVSIDRDGTAENVSWSISGDGAINTSTGLSTVYTAPDDPGTFTVTASGGGGSSVTFTINVRRPSTSLLQPLAIQPRNPSGPIPSLLTGNDGTAFETITPEEGGSFIGDGFHFAVPRGAVRNEEFYGVHMSVGGDADNTGKIDDRYTLNGRLYNIGVIDASGNSVLSYGLQIPGEVLLPMPAEMLARIDDIRVLALNPDGSQTALTSKAVITNGVVSMSAQLSSLPATVAVGIVGAPLAPTAIPVEAPEVLPDTGAASPSFSIALAMLAFGIVLILIPAAVTISRRARNGNASN